jgi:iron complex outermembrane receptor protein
MKTYTRFRRTVVSRAAITALCGTAAMVLAQETLAQQQSSTTLQRVEVTGSNIKRTDTETASPVQVITRQEIENSGKANVAEYLQTLTADAQGSVPFTYGRGFAGASAAGISLRGLGANATLVLINGRRAATAVLADDAQRTFVDLNTIPLEAVERVEVLKDGASSIYGSDAVAGVVNIILRKNFQGGQIKAQYGTSYKNDGNEPKVSAMYGRGDLDKDGWNFLVGADLSKKDAIYYRDRVGRGLVGVSAIGNPAYGLGFDPNASSNNLTLIGGEGWIPTNSATGAGTRSIIGNVRNPSTLAWYSRGDTSAGTGFTRTFAAAQAYCNANANLPQNNPRGGCLMDHWQQAGLVQPQMESSNLYGRFTKQFNATTEASFDINWYHAETKIQREPVTFDAGINTPSGIPISQAASTVLGANHPDNPYFGTAARLRYSPLLDPAIGPNRVHSNSDTFRAVGALKGTFGAWDYDTGIVYSEARQTDTSEAKYNWRVKNALLNPTPANIAAAMVYPEYAALVGNSTATAANTFYRIGENVGLNSPQLYAALLKDLQRKGTAKLFSADFKASREIGQLPGGPIGIAVGAEYRKEENDLPFYDGLGDYAGLSLTKYSGKHNIYAVYTEGNFPVTKRLEANAAVRYDHYSDAGGSVTPKVGAKFKVIDTLALRSTYAKGFRAPSPTENSLSSIAAFGGATVNDPVRCAGTGVPTANCNGIAPTFVQQGNPDLKPEKSTSLTFGGVWDITPATSVTLDWWQIKRTGLPVIENTQDAIDRGQYIRDPAAAISATDPGPILVGFVRFQNSDESLTRGIDLEAKHRFNLGGGWGRLDLGVTWTHLLNQRVTNADGTVHEYAGTHGNCEITNCIGSPRDRIQFTTAWDMGRWRLAGVVNYRGSMENRLEKGDPCWSEAIAIGGADIPAGCKVGSFWTLDVSGNYRINDKLEVYGSIQNLTDKKPPFDPMTYGAIGYNPLDYSGAIGRFFRVGLRARF